MEGTSQRVLGSSDQRKVPASLSLFLKSEKILALHYVGKGPEYRPFSYARERAEVSTAAYIKSLGFPISEKSFLHSGALCHNSLEES
jgi:hypothetical protein